MTKLHASRMFGVAAVCFAPVAIIQWWDLLNAPLGEGPESGTSLVNNYFLGSGYESLAFPISVVLAVLVLRGYVLAMTDTALFGMHARTTPRIWREIGRLAVHSVIKYAALALATLVLVIPALAAAVWFGVSESSVYSEHAGPLGALKRSYQLVKSRFFEVAGTLAVFTTIRLASGFLLISFAQLTVVADLQPASIRLSIVIGTYLASVVIWPVALCAKALLFADLRVRNEALDLDLMIHDLATSESETSRWETHTPAGAPANEVPLWDAP